MQWSPLRLIKQMNSLRVREAEMAAKNPYLAQAMEFEKKEGHRLAVIARTIALVLIMFLLPVLNPNWHVVFYEGIVLLFIGLGWLQYRVARVGYSRLELFLILLDVLLLTLIFIIPNPFMDEDFPTAILYRFDNFVYFYVILAVATLAYSWRTVWAIGTWVPILWLLGLAAVSYFGNTIPELDIAAKEAFEGRDLVTEVLMPNSLTIGLRLQEVVLFLIVAAILAIKGYRSNLLLMRQANIAAERANLSRYFPSSLVDSLASTNHDIGAVRSQEVAVLFTDIVGFTEYAERTNPDDVMDLLRQYHALVESAIFENGGTLEKYIGDGVMATFGRPEPSSEDAANALLAACQIIHMNEELNEQRAKENKEAVRISIGIHHGSVILGDIGPERRLEFAVVGDTVNVAARLEAESRNLKCSCVVSEAAFSRIGEDCPHRDELFSSFKSHGELRLRGKSKPINVWVS